MSDRTDFSDELLNALIDEQLAPEDAERIYTQMQQDPELTRRVCELRALREMVRLSYRDVPRPTHWPTYEAPASPLRWRYVGALAAGIVVALGTLLAWPTRDEVADPTAAGLAAQPRVAALGDSAGAAPSLVIKVLFHLNSNDRDLIKQSLQDVESALKLYRQRGQRARVQIVANGEGLDLLRVGASPYPQTVQRMLQEYDNLQFVACQNTIDRLKRERGVTARLLPGVTVIDSGVAEIMRRQREGWVYIRA